MVLRGNAKRTVIGMADRLTAMYLDDVERV